MMYCTPRNAVHKAFTLADLNAAALVDPGSIVRAGKVKTFTMDNLFFTDIGGDLLVVNLSGSNVVHRLSPGKMLVVTPEGEPLVMDTYTFEQKFIPRGT